MGDSIQAARDVVATVGCVLQEIRFFRLICVRLLGLILLTVLLLPATSGCGSDANVERARDQENEPSSTRSDGSTGTANVDRISFVGTEGDLFTIGPDGNEMVRLTGGVRLRGEGGPLAQSLDNSYLYAWPTWSPDGTKLAASKVEALGTDRRVTVEVIDVSNSRARTIHEGPVNALVAQGAPHYLYWAPDSRSLAFIAATNDGLTLFVDDTEDPGSPVAVEVGAPLYFQWAADSNSLLIHLRDEVKLAQRPFGTQPRVLLRDSLGYRAPAISPQGTSLAYGMSDGASMSLFVAPINEPENAMRVAELGPLSAFMWAPSGDHLAIADQTNQRSPLFERLVVVAREGGTPREIARGLLMAFFWDPQGAKIAWVELDRSDQTFNLFVAEANGEAAHRVFRFRPSRDMLTMLGFFDQYAYSHSPWSPDGERLVVSGSPAPASRNGRTAEDNRVFVLRASGDPEPQEIAVGRLAFWSWN